MKFTCTQENLLLGLSRVVPVSGRNTQLPILQQVLLELKDNALHLTATDLEVGVHTVVGGKADEGGKATVPARGLLDYVGQLPTTHPIEMNLKKTGIEVSTKGFRAVFPIGDSEDFPLLPSSGADTSLELPGVAFTESVGRVLFAAAREETRPEIRSVYMKAQEGGLRLAATDSFRLCEEIMEVPSGVEFELLLPLSSAVELPRLFSGVKALAVGVQESYVLFSGGGVEMSSRLVDGRYPDYQQIIPSSWKTKSLVRRRDLIRALKTLQVFLSRDSRRVRFDINPDKNQLMSVVTEGVRGKGDVATHIEGEGVAVSIVLNMQYVLEGLQHINDDMCVIECGGAQDPVVFRPRDRSGYVYVVMPIQAN